MENAKKNTCFDNLDKNNTDMKVIIADIAAEKYRIISAAYFE